MRACFACLILMGAGLVLSGCAERRYRPYYRGGGYYPDYRYSDHDRHDRRHDERRDRSHRRYDDHD